MFLQFVGFVVVFGAGALALWWGGRELWYYGYCRMSAPLTIDDGIEVTIFVLACCVGCGLLYYAGIHAPFEINLKV